MEEKMSPSDFIYYRFPEFEKVPVNELTHLISSDMLLILMEEYHIYRKQIELKENSYNDYH